MSSTKGNKKAGNGAAPEAKQEGPAFSIQRIYVQDLSFESPNPLEIFRSKDWQPNIHMDLHTEANKVEEGMHEVVLRVTLTAKLEEKTAFVVEVKQAGIFSMAGFEADHMHHMLGSFCPNLLFPYAREAVSNLIERGGFPHVYLQPVNFEALYQQHLTEKKSKQDAAAEK